VKTCGQCGTHLPDAVEFCPNDGARLPGETKALYDSLIGQTIDGRYIVEALLGQGGMGSVYGARHAIIDKRCAIKVLRADAMAQDPTAAQRFLAEAKAASKIGHQNIVDITDFGVLADGKAYFVMEFLDGPTLGKIVHTSGHLAPTRAIGITVQIARGLQAAHDKDIIHRDLKPENIFILERDGQTDIVKIVDFGIARDTRSKKRLTQIGMVLGTPEYMSPEQATGQPTDPRVDMYALGCILYEMLTGDVPFKEDSATKTLTAHVFTQPVPPSKKRPDLQIPPSLEAVIMRTLQKKPTDRFADMRELMSALDRVDGELRGGRPDRRDASQPVQLSRVAAQVPRDTSTGLEVPRKSRAPLYAIGGVVAAGALAGIIALATSGGKKPVVAKTVAAAKPVQPVDAPIENAPPSAAPKVELVLRSRPAGAEVFINNERQGTTPLTLTLPRNDAPVRYIFKLAGYRDETRTLAATGDKEIEVNLDRPKVAVNKHPTTPHTPPPTPTPTPTPKPKGRVSDLRNPFE
jgi:serine/threonine-protein kinase